MDLDWEHRHRFNIILLSTVGLWPYGNRFVLGFQRLIGSFFTTLCLFANMSTFVTVDYNRTLLLENASYILVSNAMFFKFVSYLAASDCIKRITENINRDWRDLSSKEEIQIIEKYVKRGKFHTKSFAMFICPSATVLTFAPLASVVLDIVMPLNESRSRSFPIMFEVFFDQQEYFCVMTPLFQGVIIVGALVFVSTEALFIVYIQHVCALFEVTSYRIKNYLSATGTRNSKSCGNFVMIAQVVEIHSRAIRQCKTIKETFIRPYLILVALGILSLSTHLFRFTKPSATEDLTTFLASGLVSLAILGYIFYFNFMLQDVLDSSADIFDILYDSEWYKFPTSTQKLVLFCMFKTIKPVSMDICSIFQPSYEGFSVILKMVVSYVAALYSFQ